LSKRLWIRKSGRHDEPYLLLCVGRWATSMRRIGQSSNPVGIESLDPQPHRRLAHAKRTSNAWYTLPVARLHDDPSSLYITYRGSARLAHLGESLLLLIGQRTEMQYHETTSLSQQPIEMALIL
jgi:hypothetical protein